MSEGRKTKALSAAPWPCNDLALPAHIIRLLQRMTRKLRRRADFRVQIVEHDENNLWVWIRWWKKS